MKRYLAIAGLALPLLAAGQRLPEVGTNVRIILPDQTIVAEIRPLGSTPVAEPEKVYYWYGSNSIHQTQGGYSGHLLNGAYSTYDLQKNLKTQGNFSKGLKDGLWKAWNADGTLQELIPYRKGLRSGAYSRYDEKGKLAESGRYRGDERDGRIRIFNGEAYHDVIYKKGKAQPAATKVPFWRKLHLFKKKPRK